jgi:hypothetical protein
MGDVWLRGSGGYAKRRAELRGREARHRQPEALVPDLRARVVNRPQITSDGYTPYLNAVTLAFQMDVDYAVLTKKYVGGANLPDPFIIGAAAHRQGVRG